MKVDRPCILTVPSGMAEPCWPKTIRQVEDGRLQKALSRAASTWLSTKDKEGFAFVEQSDIHVYGPFPSRMALEAYVTEEHLGVDEHDREALVTDSDEASVFSLYLLNASFVVAGDRAPKE